MSTKIPLWRPIENAPGYRVSSHGQIRSPWKMLKLSFRNGYHVVHVPVGDTRINLSVHVEVARAFLGPCPLGKEINHIDGVKTNNRDENLEYVTHAENGLHAHRLGLRTPPRGERSGTAKLTVAGVLDVVRRLRGGDNHGSIAADLGVSRRAIYSIATGRKWRHLPEVADLAAQSGQSVQPKETR
jgi:hypothetical protein